MTYKTQKHPDNSSMEPGDMLVIGAGLPRTGTTSLTKALEKLLHGSCHHGSKIRNFTDSEADFWLRALDPARRSPVTSREWREYFKYERASLDLPSILFYKELLLAYPHAKVILTARDPRSWFRSWSKSQGTLLRVLSQPPQCWIIRQNPKIRKIHERARAHAIPWCDGKSLDDAFKDVKHAEEFYASWVEEVKATVPKEKLLIYDVRSGWEPLCKFLGVAVPSEPFPHENTTKEVQSSIAAVRKQSWLTFLMPLVVLIVSFLLTLRVLGLVS